MKKTESGCELPEKIFMVSRCAWTLFNFREGLMRALLKKDAVVTGAGAAGDGFEKKINALGVPYKNLPIDKKGVNPVSDIKLLFALYQWYRKEQPDLVHHFTIKPVIYGSIAAQFAGVPRIVNTITGLGYVFTEEEAGWLRRVVEIMYRISLKCAHHTFFQNMDDLHQFILHHLVNGNQSSVLPGSGVNCNHFKPRDIITLTPETQDVLMVSRLLKDKGVYEFVEAARLIKKLQPKVRFQLLGRLDERNPNVITKNELNNWKNEGLVDWLGEVDDVRPVVAGADIVALPSYYREGVPRVLLEAAAMGKPIITTDAIGCREVVEHGLTGLIVPVKDAQALAQSISLLLAHPEMRQEMGIAGRAKMKAEFDEKIVIDKTMDIYSKVYSTHFLHNLNGKIKQWTRKKLEH